MAKILLDYFFKIVAVNPTPAASTAFLKQVCVVVSPKDGGVTTGVVTLCTSKAAIAALTNNLEANELIDAGLSRVYILPMDDLDLIDVMATEAQKFFTLLISSDFDDDDIEPTAASGSYTITSYANLISGTPDVITVGGVAFTAQAGAATLGTATFRAATSNDATAASLRAQINAHAVASLAVVASGATNQVIITAVETGSAGNALTLGYTDNDVNVGATKTGATLTGGDGLSVGVFDGVIGISSDDEDALEDYNATENYCGFYGNSTNKGKNMFYAFGKLLSNPTDWKNQQYITMPYDDGIDELGEAENLFDINKTSFVIADDEFGKRLALFACGGKAIVAPYIIRNLEIDLQSKALQYVSANQPGYTYTHAALLEDELQKVIDGDGQPNGNSGYVGRGWITEGNVQITLEQDNFIASGAITVPTPRAMWRIAGQITQS